MFITALAITALQPAAASKPLLDFPHPLITEILYDVPGGKNSNDGDANNDGSRHPTGDEFIELINPHDKPINLRGYTLTGKPGRPPKNGEKPTFTQLSFTFPDCELKPGEVAVVFNGYDQKWSAPVGDSTRAADPASDFTGARVFTMRNTSEKVGLANKSDSVLLTSPAGPTGRAGDRLHCITWGEISAPRDTKLVEAAPTDTRGSITRLTPGGPLTAHPALDQARYSPGKFPADSAAAPEPTPPKPQPTPPAKP
jgi:hypothetical protein